MKRRAGITFAASLLALSLWSLTGYSADDDDDDKKANAEAQKAIIKLMDSMNGKKDNVQGQAQAIKMQFKDEVKPVMWVYKSRKKGGLGFGKDGDDIEQTIGKIGNPRGKLGPKKILEMKGDLAKAGELSRAIVEVADLYANDYKDTNTGKKNPAKWKEHMQAMRKGADELIEASKGNDAAKIKKAAGNLSASCTNCHSDFRQ